MASKKAPKEETHAFQTEMQQLLQIIIHSLYSEREIFLRELISNASDAINRLKFRQLTEKDLRDPDVELGITLEADSESKEVRIHDTGIGLTRDEMIRNLGTIARSGTLEFVKELSAAGPNERLDLIGQFGVGFYSVFMVAKRVTVESCPANPKEAAHQWVSEGQGEYAIRPSNRTNRGTTITIELNEESEEFSHGHRLEDIVRRYSSFIPHPIRLEDRQLNTQQAIWAKSRQDVTADQYQDFYKFLTHNTDEALHTLHLSIDAPVQYQSILYIPKHLTNEVLYSPKAGGLNLYANKVLIQPDSQDLLPMYLRFMRGVVDTQDLPLNVSRETVQNNPLLAKLRSSLTGRVLRDLKEQMEKQPETFREIWKQYGKIIKEGVSSDYANRERLVELLRFHSSACENADDVVTLKEYVARMQEGQQEIFYFSGPSREAIANNPQMEFFKKRNLEVLYLFDQVDDFVMAALGEFDGKKLASIDQSELEAFKDDETAPEGERVEGEALDGLISYMKETLGDGVSEVRPSKRLVDSPALLVSSDGIPGNLQKMMRMMNADFQSLPKILEINPAAPLIRDMATLHGADAADATLKELTEQLFENCMLMEGLLEKPERMVGRLQSLMARTAALQVKAAEK